ncbi:MAG: tRNA (adenosine(37)-N6)-dimethylallyltransferase MiaA [Deltaproteobacteria bacterium]|jgi:tRNA dimethylallyltransferase|nr:tRNA (adenosine(37)-N6)-dimethylallyltransferase MiaA [Deltaproteobacteria bacterium]
MPDASGPRPRLVIVAGPTGSGKSALAARLAARIGGAVINADSLALYRGLDIGTAKPGPEETALAPHHLVSVLDPSEPCDAARYSSMARPLVAGLWAGGVPPVACGGTGLYLRTLAKGLFEGPPASPALRGAFSGMERDGIGLHSVLEALDPETASRLNPRDRVRVERALEVVLQTGSSMAGLQDSHALSDRPFDVLALVLEVETEELDRRIGARTDMMFEAGLVEEVRGLLARGYSPDLKPLMSIGYREAVMHIRGELTLGEARELVRLNTRRLAKRQRTWFRGQLPEGRRIPPDLDAALREAEPFLAS